MVSSTFINSLSTKIHLCLCKPLQIPSCEALIGVAGTNKFKTVREGIPDQMQPGKEGELIIQHHVHLSISDKSQRYSESSTFIVVV